MQMSNENVVIQGEASRKQDSSSKGYPTMITHPLFNLRLAKLKFHGLPVVIIYPMSQLSERLFPEKKTSVPNRLVPQERAAILSPRLTLEVPPRIVGANSSPKSIDPSSSIESSI
jgi:hypothetical protein